MHRSLLRLLSLALLPLLLPTATEAAITIDGVADPDYGGPLAGQQVQSQFGSSNLGQTGAANGSELDQAYGVIRGGALHLHLAGNLESNGNKLNLFFDSVAGGQNRLRGDNPFISRMGDSGGPNGMTFDAGLDSDYWIGVNISSGPFVLFADYTTLPTSSGGTGAFLGSNNTPGGDGTLGGGSNPYNIRVTVNNTNTAGVGGCGCPCTPDSGVGVTTGVELAIPLAALGNPTGPIRVMAVVSSSDYAFLSNQVLGPVPNNYCNIGEPRGRSFAGDAGDQFFVVPPPPDCNTNSVADVDDFDPAWGVWQQATTVASWGQRVNHAVLAFGGRMWLYGGYSGGVQNDVWSSTDGAEWTEATANAAWSARVEYPAVDFSGRMWILGGSDGISELGDVWYSTDGADWQLATASAWPIREKHVAESHDGRIWVFSGFAGGHKNDVWFSADGATWTRATASAGWSARSDAWSASHDGKIWLLGGYNGVAHNDVWHSADGIAWTQATATAPWPARHQHPVVVHDGRMWVLGGGSGHGNDVWWSTNGAAWTQATAAAPWIGRRAHHAMAFAEGIWLTGGYDGASYLSDVWRLAPTSSDCNGNTIPDECDVQRVFTGFGGAAPYSTDDRAMSVATGLLNGDGSLDLAVANFFSHSVSVLMNNGDGTFGAAANYTVGTNPLGVAIGDFDRDGLNDIVNSNIGAGTVSILRNTGGGAFTLNATLTAGTVPMDVVVFFADGDEFPDIAVANRDSSNISVFINDGTGSFASAVNYSAGTDARSLVAADFDGDAFVDLATTGQYGVNGAVLFNNGDGTFGSPATFAVGTEKVSLTSGRFNDDASPDLAVASLGSGEAIMLLNDGSGAFPSSVTLSVSSPTTVTAIDVEGDGDDDLAVGHGPNGILLYENFGAASFASPQAYATGNYPHGTAAADLDGDGITDLVMALIDADRVDVLINASSPPTSNDCNANGVPDECDIAGGADCNENSVPDDCESFGDSGRLYVDQSATGDNDGSSWDDALTEVRAALCIAVSYGGISEIWVADGTYRPTTAGGDRAVSFRLVDGVSIYGGFAGGETDLGDRDPQTNSAILSGDLNGDDGARGGGNGENSYHVVYADVAATLDGFTITGGNADDLDFPNGNGGGVFLLDNASAVTNCIIIANAARNGGGGVYVAQGAPTFTDCTFSENTVTDSHGGGMYSDNASPTLSFCGFNDNGSIDGAGLYNAQDSAAILTNCDFDSNITNGGDGGGIYNYQSAVDLMDCSFTNNVADGGGGMMLEEDTGTTAEGCTFQSNTARDSGGGLHVVTGGTPVFNSCQFDGNTADTFGGSLGGSVYIENSQPEFHGSDFSTSEALYGGGMAIVSASPIIDGCNFDSNVSAGGSGGGLYAIQSSLSASTAQFDYNSAGVGGGAYFENDAGSTLDFCDFTANSSDDAGGGVYMTASNPSLTGCTFVSNTAGGSGGGGLAIDDVSNPSVLECSFTGNDASGSNGGAVWINNSSEPSLESCTFTGNTASYGGGVMCDDESSPTLTLCTFDSNEADEGGGMFSQFSLDANLSQCDFLNNVAYGNGGGAIFYDGSPSMDQCVFDGNQAGTNGGGAYFINTDGGAYSPSLTACIFQNNSAASEAGGVYNEECSLSLTGCTITGNSAGINGGGMNSGTPSAQVVLDNCIFANNAANSGAGLFLLSSPDVTLTNCTFAGNPATDAGGGIFSDQSSPTLTDCIFPGNTAYRGGAIHAVGGDLSASHCVFNGNASDDGAGAMYLDFAATGSIRDSIFTGNTSYPGGALFIDNDANPEFDNCLFAGNFSGNSNGGAAWNNGPCSPKFINCTFARNSTDAATGGAMLNEDSSTSIVNCIFWDNTANSNTHEAAQYDGPPEVVTYSLVQGLDALSGTGNVGDHPRFVGCFTGYWTQDGQYDSGAQLITFTDESASFVPGGLVGRQVNPSTDQSLQFTIVDNSTTTMTVWSDAQTIANSGSWVSAWSTYQICDYRLSSPSPGIDAGDNAAVPGDLTEDLDHGPRYVDYAARVDTGSGSPPIVDMGAYEYFPDCNTNGVLDDQDLAGPTSADCNGNFIPDECDLAAGTSEDCNTNTLLDACDIAGSTSRDCNTNGLADECEIAERAQLTVTDLGVLPGGSTSFATAVNNSGWIVGQSTTHSGDEHAFLWRRGRMIDLGTLGSARSEVAGINEAGQVAGHSETGAGEQNAFRWQDGVMSDLGTLPDGAYAQAIGINALGEVFGKGDLPGLPERGFIYTGGMMVELGTLAGTGVNPRSINDNSQIVGYIQIPTPNQAFLWESGVMTDIGSLAGGSNAASFDINNLGQIVGISNTAAESGHNRAFFWESGVMTDIGTFGGLDSHPADINDQSQVVGHAEDASNHAHAFFWEDGALTDLGTLGGLYSYAVDINEAGQVIGRADIAGGDDHPFLWEDGVLTDLYDWLPPEWSNVYVYAMNDAGQIVGQGDIDGQTHGILISLALPLDCNGSGIFDACEIAAGTSADCNTNNIPDECDIAAATSQDDDDDGIPNQCENDTQLILVFGNNARAPEDCIQPGSGTNETLVVRVDLRDASRPITGGQFFLSYDAGVIEFITAVPGDAPFTREVYEAVDGMNGALSYAVGIENEGLATTADSTMAIITFRAVGEQCAETTLLRFSDPGDDLPPTRLADDNDGEVLAALIDLQTITSDFTPPDLLVPSDISVHSDAGECQATFTTFIQAAATDNCDTDVTISFSRDDSQPNLLDPYQPGTTSIMWTAEDNCGNTTTGVQTIIVSDQNEVLVDVELSPTLDDTNGPSGGATLERCISFQAWECPGAVPLAESSTEVIFPADAMQIHRANGVSVLLPCDVYTCLTARDTLHTLRSTAPDFTDEGTTYSATYVGNRATGGHWLLHGNLNDDRFIDILDFGSFVIRFQSTYDSEPDTFIDGHTDCSTPLFHADISGDGRVFTEDFTFIQINFLKRNEDNCCGAVGLDDREAGAASSPLAASSNQRSYAEPVRSISVADLWRMGMGELAAADLNADGKLDEADMATFAQGQGLSVRPALSAGDPEPEPVQPPRASKRF